MKTFGEGFDTDLAGLEGKPGALIPRENSRQPGAVVMDVNVNEGGVDPYGLPDPATPRIDQPRVKGAISA